MNKTIAPIVAVVITLSAVMVYLYTDPFNKSKKTEFKLEEPVPSPAQPREVMKSVDDSPILRIILKDQKEIVINFDTGRVTHKGIPLDEASAAFWDKAVLQYPQFKKRIIKNYLEAQSKTVK